MDSKKKNRGIRARNAWKNLKPCHPGLEMTGDAFPGFFDEHELFLDSSTVASNKSRLNFRASMIVDRNRHAIEGKRILDIACHDARFSVAAVAMGGARQVVGVEAREDVADRGRANIKQLGYSEDRISILCADMMEALPKFEPGEFDTVFLLGILYHTARHYEIAQMIGRLKPKYIVIDSNVLTDQSEPMVKLKWEGTFNDGNIWDGDRTKVISALPSEAALQYYFADVGYKSERILPDVAIPRPAKAYFIGSRVTMLATRETA